jgi:hypothetical protein
MGKLQTTAMLRFMPCMQIYFSSSILPSQNKNETNNHEKTTETQEGARNEFG